LDFLHGLIIFVATWVGESFGAMFGGSGFIIQPALLLAGIEPHAAVANDVAAACVSGIFFTFFMHGQGHVDWKIVGWAAPVAFIGTIAGGFLLKIISPAMVLWMVIAISAAGLVYQLFHMKMHKAEFLSPELHPRRHWQVFTAAAGGILGLYNGISGAGSGMLLRTMLATIFSGSTKALIGTSSAINGISLLIAGFTFLYLGLLDWKLMAILVPANFLAAWTASKIINRVSEKSLRIAFIVATSMILAVLLAQQLTGSPA